MNPAADPEQDHGPSVEGAVCGVSAVSIGVLGAVALCVSYSEADHWVVLLVAICFAYLAIAHTPSRNGYFGSRRSFFIVLGVCLIPPLPHFLILSEIPGWVRPFLVVFLLLIAVCSATCFRTALAGLGGLQKLRVSSGKRLLFGTFAAAIPYIGSFIGFGRSEFFDHGSSAEYFEYYVEFPFEFSLPLNPCANHEPPFPKWSHYTTAYSWYGFRAAESSGYSNE